MNGCDFSLTLKPPDFETYQLFGGPQAPQLYPRYAYVRVRIDPSTRKVGGGACSQGVSLLLALA